MWKMLVPSLYDEQNSLPVDENLYSNLVTDEDFNMVAPQIYYLLKETDRLREVPDLFQAKLKEKFGESLIQNFFIKNQCEQVLMQFEEKGIDVIPFKGVGFSEKVFGHLAARPTSDIDLLIHKEDLDKAIECSIACGFILEEEVIPQHFHVGLSKPLPGSTIPLKVELHWTIVRENTSAFAIQEFWQEAVPRQAYQHIKELSKYHTFYMICLHSWRHNLQSLKYFLDIIQLIHVMRGELDYSRLIKDAARHKTSKRIIRTLSIVYHEFTFLEEWVAFPYQRRMNFVKSHLINKYADYVDYQFFSFDTMSHSVKEFLYWLKHEVIGFKKQSHKDLSR